MLVITDDQDRSRHLTLRPVQREPLAPEPPGHEEADHAGWQGDGHVAAGHLQTQHVAGNRHHGEEPERGDGDGLVLLGPVPEQAAVVGTVQAQHEQPGDDQHHSQSGVSQVEEGSVESGRRRGAWGFRSEADQLRAPRPPR